MAKNDNLTDFLTDIADAIRHKRGTSSSINPQDFSKEIKDIYEVVTQGVKENAVTFYDYDGTILYSFAKEEFLRLGNMPPLPTRKGMTYQQWNWSYEDAAQHLAKYDIIEVAAICITDDGKTRLYVTIDTYNNRVFKLLLDFFEISIQWGDGIEKTYTRTNSSSLGEIISHEYSEIGDYCICITVISGSILFGDDINYSSCIRSNHKDLLRRIEFGENFYLRGGGFADSGRLESVNFPIGVTSIPRTAFNTCRSLVFIGLPYGCENISRSAFYGCSRLRVVSLPNTIKKVGERNNYSSVFAYTTIKNIYISGTINSYHLFQGCYSLSTVYLPEYYEIGEYMFEDCAIGRIDIPEGVTKTGRFAFDGCKASYIKFPSTLKEIEAGLTYLSELTVADFTACASVPDLEKLYPASRFPSGFKIVVADVLFEDWLDMLINISDRVGDYVCWPFLSTDVIPSECLSLEISPLDSEVSAKDTNVGLKISAMVNGRKITTGETVENAIYKATAYSNNFEANTSSEPITREITYTLLGVSATTIITQAGVAATTES